MRYHPGLAAPPSWGHARIDPAGPVTAAGWGTWTILYTAGPAGITMLGGIRVSVPNGFTRPQTKDPQAPGYVTATCENPNAVLDVWVTSEGIPYLPASIHVKVRSSPLRPGESIRVVYGDRSGGGSGAQAWYVAWPVEFLVAADVPGVGGDYRYLADAPRLQIVPQPASVTLEVSVPSVVGVGEIVPVHVVARDSCRNTLPGARRFSVTMPGAGQSEHRSGSGALWIPEAVGAPAPGIYRISVRDVASGVSAESNPLRVAPAPAYRVLWGDIHVMTGLSCAEHPAGLTDREILDQAYRYARDDAGLDFTACTDLDFLLDESDWDLTRDRAVAWHRPGTFVTFSGYEYAERVWGGDKTVLYLTDDELLFHSTDPETNSPPKLWAALRARGVRAITFPHHPASLRIGTNWDYHDAEFQRLAEVYSSWGNSEYLGCPRALNRPSDYLNRSVHAGLGRGYRLGIVANSDSHTGTPGCSTWMFFDEQYLGGLTAVWARARTREAIWEALFARRAYGTTHARILLDFRVNGHFMGEEIRLRRGEPVTLSVAVEGTNPIERVDIVKNLVAWKTFSGDGAAWRGTLEDYDTGQRPDFYFVRVTQADGEMAWSSPVWVDWQE